MYYEYRQADVWEMRNTCPSPFLVAVPPSRCGPSEFTRKLQDMHLARHFGNGNTRKPDVTLIINWFFQDNCKSNLELDCLVTWWVAFIYAIISKSCLGTLRVQPGKVTEGVVQSSRLLRAQTRATGGGLRLQEGCQKSHVRYGRPRYVARSNGL